MLIARHLLSCISKAVKNNQKSIILKINQVKNFYILDVICKHGFIQGYEVRGHYIIVSLKQVYRNSITISAEKSLNSIIPIKRKKNSCSISAKEWNSLTRLSGSSACYIISTDRGIYDNRNKLNIGGFPLLKIL